MNTTMAKSDYAAWLAVLAAACIFALVFYFFDKALRKAETANRKTTEAFLTSLLSAAIIVASVAGDKYVAESCVLACIIWCPTLSIGWFRKTAT